MTVCVLASENLDSPYIAPPKRCTHAPASQPLSSLAPSPAHVQRGFGRAPLPAPPPLPRPKPIGGGLPGGVSGGSPRPSGAAGAASTAPPRAAPPPTCAQLTAGRKGDGRTDGPPGPSG